MPILITLLTIVEVLVCLLLVLIIMMQRPRQEGLGASFGSGVMDHLAGAQTTNVLQKGTSWLAAAMFVTTVLLAALVSKQHPKSKDKLFQEPKPVAAVESKPSTPEAAKTTPAATGPALKPTPGGAPASPVISVQPQGATVTKLPAGGDAAAKPAPSTSTPAKAPATPAAGAKPAPAPAPTSAPAPAAQPVAPTPPAK